MTPEELSTVLRSPEVSLDDALLYLSAILSGRDDALEVGQTHLDELAAGVRDPSISGLVSHLFDSVGFAGDIDNYHNEENSLLDRVLERRVGMPITLSAVVAAVGRRLGIDLHLIGMPGHVIVGVPKDPGRFIDAFGGTELNENGVLQRFEAIFGPKTDIPPGALRPIDTISVVNRVCNNLTRTWADTDSRKLNRLLEVRVALPTTENEQRLLINIAEARGRFDLAAQLRHDIDPDDPQIDVLWARLN